jgi:uncharacterized membrane protein YsdA (DUF1294 family)/cold shock CspA family protein
MRYQGRITNWKDDQGFGFVTPNGGGQKAFAHVKAFSDRSLRPVDGDILTYELATDEKGRFCAKNIRFAKDRAMSTSSRKTSSLGINFAILFCFVFALSALLGWLPLQIVGLYLTASIITFIAYAIDKSSAQKNRWRTKESTLHLFSLVGGWPGALLAQIKLRHKSRKEEFQTVFWVTVFINCSTLGWLLTTKSGATFLSSFLGLAA